MDDTRNKQNNASRDNGALATVKGDAVSTPHPIRNAEIPSPETFRSTGGICWDESEEGESEA